MATTIQKDGRQWHVDSTGINSLTRRYAITLDTNNLPSNGETPLNGYNLPIIGSSHPLYSNLKVQSYDVEEGEDNEKKILNVTVNYAFDDSSSSGGSEGDEYNIEHWGWDLGTSDQELTTDISGNAVLNSAKDPFENVPIIQVPTPTFTKTVKYKDRKSGWNTLVGCVNNADVTIGGITFLKWTLLCNISEERIYGEEWMYRYNVQLKYKSTKARLYGKSEEKEIGWQLAIVDAGIREIGPDGKKRVILLPSTDSNIDVAVTSPTLLDGKGKAIVIKPDSQEPVKPYCGLFYAYIPTSFEDWMTAEQG